jgi:hypothetical protein
MELITAIIDRDTDLYDVSDVHLGSALCYEKGAAATIKKIAEDKKHNRLIFGGDANESILITDKRFTISSTKEAIIDDQILMVQDLFAPAKDNIVAWLIGNHEAKLWNYGNIGKRILQSYGKEKTYGGMSCVITFKDRRGNLLFKMYKTHGRKALNNSNPDPMKRRVSVGKAQGLPIQEGFRLPCDEPGALPQAARAFTHEGIAPDIQ